MVTVAVDWTMAAFDGVDRTTVKLRLAAAVVRLMIGTEMVCSVWPGPKVSMPLVVE